MKIQIPGGLALPVHVGARSIHSARQLFDGNGQWVFGAYVHGEHNAATPEVAKYCEVAVNNHAELAEELRGLASSARIGSVWADKINDAANRLDPKGTSYATS